MKALLLLAVLPLCGCVERLIALRSDPDGAEVYVDGEKVGQTPIDVPYVWYGTREIVLEKRGYREIRERVALNPPWWQYPGLDFITDVLLPFTLTDRVEYAFHLERAPVSREEIGEVLRRAEETRALSEPSKP